MVSITLLGDLVASRHAPDRTALHRRLSDALDVVAATTPPRTPLVVTAGDEFQGTFDTLGSALHVTFLLRLQLAPVDARFGIGRGGVQVLDTRSGVQDGPGWWSARAALQEVTHRQRGNGWRDLRTRYQPADETGGPSAELVNAALQCRDALMGSLDDRDRTILGGLMAGGSQARIAEDLGISAQAVSQRMQRRRLAVLLGTAELLRGLA